MLRIVNLCARCEDHPILQGFSLEIKEGEIHVIMGPNGAGKSTLAKVLAGHPSYEVTEGEVWLNGVNLLDLDPEERAKKGLFVSFQYPIEVKGITNLEFLKLSYNSLKQDELSVEQLKTVMQEMQMKEQFLGRDLNDGFSGGEKKRNEILQMLTLDPVCAILDETDSGLDIDALKAVAEGINRFMTPQKMLLLITHYQRLLNYIVPDFVHVMMEGKIIRTGGKELALELEEKGYAVC